MEHRIGAINAIHRVLDRTVEQVSFTVFEIVTSVVTILTAWQED
jgi:hypothetical protein